MNTVFFTGNVGSDAVVRSAGDSDVCAFSVAVKQGFKQDAPTEWYRVSVWGSRGAKIAQYITKGAKVAVVGELEIGSYEGKPQYNVRAHEVDPFCGGKREEQGETRQREPATAGGGGATQFDADLDDDVPFVTADPSWEHRVR